MAPRPRSLPTVAVTVVVPFTPGQPDRDRAWEWVRKQYAEHHPDYTVVVGHGDPDRWVKAEAVMPAIDDAPDGVVVVADADVWCDDLQRAVANVESGHAWAIPHWRVRRLSKESSDRVIAGESPVGLPLDEPHYVGTAAGGLVVSTRENFLSVPLDRRFVGWGGEDRSWGLALHCLLGGAWRGREDLWHLWHPAQERLTRNVGSETNQALRGRYDAARSRPDEMRALLAEVTDAARSPRDH